MLNFNRCMRAVYAASIGLSATLMGVAATAAEPMLDFSQAIIVVGSDSDPLVAKSATVLREEVKKRTGILLPVADGWPADSTPVIAIGQHANMSRVAGPFGEAVAALDRPGREGFLLAVHENPKPAAIILGGDQRGVLYGVGRLLRKMEFRQGSILVPENLKLVTTPRYPLRGHQLGYRPKTNAYDAWTPEIYDQYIRELGLFGTNSIEILPPRTDDDYLSEHMKVRPLEMMIRLSEIIDSYGMDVWIWYPNMGEDYVAEAALDAELAEREEIFRKLKRIDHILVPGGDPGDLHPDEFFPWMDRVAVVLKKYHPGAKIWVSPQAMDPTREWLSNFYDHVNARPNWLGGVVFAPWVKTPIAKMRQIVHADIPIRRYPDITHNVACQYPVENWDFALAVTNHRECFNPRPRAMKVVHNAFDEFAIGTVTYSEGINDDVNKFVWGDQDWNPETDPLETLKDYARLFISPDYVNDLASGLMHQEVNWQGPLATNGQVDQTLQQWLMLEAAVPASVRENYRFQMGLLRACYDGYVKRRLIHETELERQAIEILRRAPEIGSWEAMEQAEGILLKAKAEPIAPTLKRKCGILSDSLFAKIGSQPTVNKHGARDRTRGAFMDGIDEPLCNIRWLRWHFENLREDVPDESERLATLDQIVNRTNPGPGGFYDNMGDFRSHQRIVRPVSWEEDPGSLQSPRIAFNYGIEDDPIPLAWRCQVGTLYETPLSLRYDNLDPGASYSVRVTYTGRRGKRIRLVADEIYAIHDIVRVADDDGRGDGLFRLDDPLGGGDADDDTIPTRQFPIPREATQDGQLVLTWSCGEGERGSQVSEIWLIKNRPSRNGE